MGDLPVVVVGGGAAGFMAAIFAASSGRRVVLLERSRDGGRKILISGGGRCNILPSRLNARQYFTDSSPNTLKKLLLSWPLSEQRRFFESELGIPLSLEESSGKLFPASNRALDVRDGLVQRARERGVELRFGSSVRSIAAAPARGRWNVTLADGSAIEAGAVILATGGLSVPATGSDGTGLRILEELGHTIHPLYPALTPLLANAPQHAALAGISLTVTLEVPTADRRHTVTGGFLFTHRGYSGPAVLDISHHLIRARMSRRSQQLFVSWTGDDAAEWDARLRTAGGTVGSVLRRALPDRLAEMLIAEAKLATDQPISRLRREDRGRLVHALAHYPLPVSGDEGYRKAEVTGGGVCLAEVDPRTLESRLHPGLFLCGELLDAFGPIGGYNFAWAWSTGRAAGLGAAQRS